MELSKAEVAWIESTAKAKSLSEVCGSQPMRARARDARRMLDDVRIRSILLRVLVSSGRHDLAADVLTYQATLAASAALESRIPQVVLALLPRGERVARTTKPKPASDQPRARDLAAMLAAAGTARAQGEGEGAGASLAEAQAQSDSEGATGGAG